MQPALLREYVRAYDSIAVSFYGFKAVRYPRNQKTYAMDPKSRIMYGIVPEVIPQIPYQLRVNWVKFGVAHEAGHLENATCLCKALDLIQNKSYTEDRNVKYLKNLHNIIVDVAHERCISAKWPSDKILCYTFWSNIEDNYWRLLKIQEVEDEKGHPNPALLEELKELQDFTYYLMLTQRGIEPKTILLPEKYEKLWPEIEDRVLSVIHNTYDSVKILDAAKILYDIIYENNPEYANALDNPSAMGKVKIVRIKGVPSGMSLPSGMEIDFDELDPDQVEYEDMEWEDYLDSLGDDKDDFLGKMVKNKNDDENEKNPSGTSSTPSFDVDENGKVTHQSPQNQPTPPQDKNRKPDHDMQPPVHCGKGNKIVITDNDVIEKGVLDRNGYMEAKAYLKGMNKLQTVLRKKLVNLSKDKKYRDLTEGRLDSRRLSRVPFMMHMAEKPIHTRIERSRSFKNVICTLLIDESGSMGGDRKYFHARCCAILFGETLGSLNIKTEIIGFSTTHKSGASWPENVTRHDPMHLFIYKSFNERLVPERLGSITARNSNIDGESLLFAGMRSISYPADRRVIFVFSDGYPAGGCSYNMQEDLRKTVTLCERSGVEVVGIGICSDAVKQFYPNYVIVNDAANLTGEFYQKLDTILSKQKR